LDQPAARRTHRFREERQRSDYIVGVRSHQWIDQRSLALREAVVSIEADIYPRQAPAKSDPIDGAIGELSMFHQPFGYYAHGVDETTATLPAGWVDRLVPLANDKTGGATGWCLEVHDLAVSKLVAGREEDLDFVRVLVRERMMAPALLEPGGNSPFMRPVVTGVSRRPRRPCRPVRRLPRCCPAP
jgi:hypothetical protein